MITSLVFPTVAIAQPVTQPLAISLGVLPNAQASVAYSVNLTASGGRAPYSWSIAVTAVPPGLVLSSLGVLSGRPGSAGKTSVSVRVTDSLGATATGTLALLVTSAPPAPPPPQRLAVIDEIGTLVITAPTAPQATVLLRSPDGYPFSAIVLTPDGHGYFAVTTSGRVVAGGDVVSLGGINRHLQRSIVAIALDPIGNGYWLVTSAGHVYGFGDAHSYGSIGVSAHAHVVGIAADAAGSGYWLATSTGGVYAFGRAPSLGTVRKSRLGRDRIVAVAAPTSSVGYELVSEYGRLYAFGSVRRAHLPTSVMLPSTITGIASVRGSSGYFVIAASGTVASIGAAQSILPITGMISVRGASAGA